MRFSDWHARLIALIEARKAMPFAWGVNDCCLWPADAVLAMTGRDPASGIRGTYQTARGAASALRLVGGLTGAAGRCGAEIAPLCAQVGDVGIVRTGELVETGAVCIGEHWMAVGKSGLGLADLSAGLRAWRVV